MRSLDESLGTAAEVSASKMRYQMDRLRRMAAIYALQRTESLAKHARALTLNLSPDQHPQERVLSGAWFLSRFGDGLADTLVEAALPHCPAHQSIAL